MWTLVQKPGIDAILAAPDTQTWSGRRDYPKVHWQRGVRYVDGGMLLSTAGLTAGVDAALHLLARRHGADLAGKVAQGLNIPPSRSVSSPKCRQYEFGPADGIFLLNAAFRWPKHRSGVWLYDGVGELALGWRFASHGPGNPLRTSAPPRGTGRRQLPRSARRQPRQLARSALPGTCRARLQPLFW